MTVWIKQGVMGTLHSEIRRAIGKLEREYKTIYITSMREDASGRRSGGSFHFDGKAIDCRFAEDEIGATVQGVRVLLGNDYDIVEYATHLHVEFDPKEE